MNCKATASGDRPVYRTDNLLIVVAYAVSIEPIAANRTDRGIFVPVGFDRMLADQAVNGDFHPTSMHLAVLVWARQE
jgi:hypothetical protein